MFHRLKKWIFALLALVLVVGAIRLYYRLTDDFRLANIQYILPFEAPWQIPELNVAEYLA